MSHFLGSELGKIAQIGYDFDKLLADFRKKIDFFTKFRNFVGFMSVKCNIRCT